MIFGVAFVSLATTIMGAKWKSCVMREKRFHSSCHLPITCEIRKEKYPHIYYPNILPLLPIMVRHNHDANVPPEQQQQPSPDSDDFDVEEGVGSTEGNSQTNDDNTTTTRKFNALEKRLDLLEEDVMDLQMNNDKMVLAYAAAVPFVLTFAMYCLRHFASSMSRD